MRKRWVGVEIGIFQGLDRGRQHIGGDIHGHPRLWHADIAAEAGEIEADHLILIAGDTHLLKLIHGFDLYGFCPCVISLIFVFLCTWICFYYSNKAHVLLIQLQFVQVLSTCLILEKVLVFIYRLLDRLVRLLKNEFRTS